MIESNESYKNFETYGKCAEKGFRTLEYGLFDFTDVGS